MSEKEINKAFDGRWRVKGFDDTEVRPLTGKEVRDMCRDFFVTGILLSENTKATTDRLAPDTLQKRQQDFYQQLVPFVGKYPKEMLRDFFAYWSEPNRSRTKMRCELQKTWEISRRLATWARNDFNGYGKSANQQQQNIDKLATILSD